MVDGAHAPRDAPTSVGSPSGARLVVRLRLALSDPRLIFTAIMLVGIIATVWTLSAFAAERNRDWFTFARAGQRLAAGLSPYVPGTAVSFLYPPAMAAIWAAGMSAPIWLLLKLATLAALVPLLGWRFALPALVLVALQTPLQYDLLMGNVTVFYIGAAVWFRWRRGWTAAAPLGLILAIAAKPAFLPLLVVAVQRRPRDVGRVLVIAAAVAVAALPVVGAGAYIDYVRALVTWAGTSAEWVGGNLGPGRYGLAVPALLLGGATLIVGLLTRDERRAAVLAFGAALLVQPAYGFYYAALLIPAAIDLWDIDHVATLGAVLVAVPLAYVSPALSGIVFILAALSWPNRPTRNSFGVEPSTSAGCCE